MTSTLKPPPKRALRAFHVGQVGTDTVGTYLEKGWSLALCCQDCERLVEWTPADLIDRFGVRTFPRIADIVPRLVCSGPHGCGGRNIAVFPHLFDGPWTWPPTGGGPAG